MPERSRAPRADYGPTGLATANGKLWQQYAVEWNERRWWPIRPIHWPVQRYWQWRAVLQYADERAWHCADEQRGPGADGDGSRYSPKQPNKTMFLRRSAGHRDLRYSRAFRAISGESEGRHSAASRRRAARCGSHDQRNYRRGQSTLQGCKAAGRSRGDGFRCRVQPAHYHNHRRGALTWGIFDCGFAYVDRYAGHGRRPQR